MSDERLSKLVNPSYYAMTPEQRADYFKKKSIVRGTFSADGRANYRMLVKLDLFQIKARKVKYLVQRYGFDEDTAREIVNYVLDGKV